MPLTSACVYVFVANEDAAANRAFTQLVVSALRLSRAQAFSRYESGSFAGALQRQSLDTLLTGGAADHHNAGDVNCTD